MALEIVKVEVEKYQTSDGSTFDLTQREWAEVHQRSIDEDDVYVGGKHPLSGLYFQVTSGQIERNDYFITRVGNICRAENVRKTNYEGGKDTIKTTEGFEYLAGPQTGTRKLKLIYNPFHEDNSNF